MNVANLTVAQLQHATKLLHQRERLQQQVLEIDDEIAEIFGTGSVGNGSTKERVGGVRRAGRSHSSSRRASTGISKKEI